MRDCLDQGVKHILEDHPAAVITVIVIGTLLLYGWIFKQDLTGEKK
jgi:FtsH-binding integral membrane protein